MRAAWLIARKDLRLRLRDRSALLVGVVVPLALAFIFNAVFGGVLDGDSLIALGWVDEDGGEVAAAFGEVMEAVGEGGEISVVPVEDLDTLERLVGEGELASGLLIPEGTSEAVRTGSPAAIRVVGDIDSPTSAAVAEAIARAFGSGVEDVQRAAAIVTELGAPEAVPAVVAGARDLPPLVTLGQLATADRVLDPATFFSASMAVFFLFFVVQFGVTGLLDERREGTLTRLEAAPIPRWSILAGKALTSVLLGMISMSVLAAATSLLMGAQWGSPPLVLVVFLAVTLAATALVGVVGSLARTAEGAANLTSAVAVALGMLGGAFFPIAGGSRWVERLSLISPHSWFLRAIGDLHAGGGIDSVVPSLLALGAFGAAGLALSGLLAGWRRR